MKRLPRRLALWIFALVCLLVFLAGLALQSGPFERWAQRAVARRIETSTGARVELRGFHFWILGLRAELDDLTLHGKEPSGATPFFHATRIDVRIRILSLLSRKFALDELTVERPDFAILLDKDGRSNVPSPPVKHPGKPWQQQLFDLRIGKFQWLDGSVIFNNTRTPISVKSQNVNLSLVRQASASGETIYVGRFEANPIELAAKRYLPFPSGLALRFTFTHSSFSLDEMALKLPRSEVSVRADLASFTQPDWTFHARGRLDLKDLREILRKPNTPAGDIEFTGQGKWSSGDWSGSGHYAAHRIDLPYVWFHTDAIESWGDYEVDRDQLRLPAFHATALGGDLAGRLTMRHTGLRFRVESRFRHASLAAILNALDHPNFPMRSLHWNASVDVDSVCTWTGGFKHFEVQGTSRWSPPQSPGLGEIPASALLGFDYAMDRRSIAITPSEISTPASRLTFDGSLGARDSALEVEMHSGNLLDWDDLITAIRGLDTKPVRVGGRADWKGRVLGPLGGPTFSGHPHIQGAVYGRLAWDDIDGKLEYSPDVLVLSGMHIRRGNSTALLDLHMQLDGAWSFLPQNPWNLSARLDGADTDPIQELLGVRYPARGTLSGEFHGGGTHAAPVLDGQFTITAGQAWGYRVDRLAGALRVAPDEVRLTEIDLQQDAGHARGNLLVHPAEQQIEFSFSGEHFSLGNVRWIQTPKLPISGEVGFTAAGRGLYSRPEVQGNFTLQGLQVGAETQGNFNGRFDSDGRKLHLALDSEMTKGKLNAQILVDLSKDYPLAGDLMVEQFDLDPLIIAGLHLKNLTGHSSVDGKFNLGGVLSFPDTLRADAHISRASFDYEFVKLENDGPIELTYRRNEVRVERAHLQGANTDFSVSGDARFDRDRPLNLMMNGSADLRLAAGLLPGLDTHGNAKLEIAIEGTMSQPQITGRASVADGSASYEDFPVGLSRVTGEFVFDRNRLSFDNVAAQAGGGDLKLSGAVSYGEGPLRYQVNVGAPGLRIRYPEGASWAAGGTLQLSGTPHAGVLSGSVAVERLLLGEGVDIATIFAPAAETGGRTSSSSYARNLQLDVSAATVPGASMDWPGAHIQMDGNLRVRGTWERPILLGSIHLLGGEMSFRGNRYQLSRGDIVFSNPLRLDPVLNVEATTSIGQNDITINFSGPASHLTLAYRSDPPLPDSDIVALLALGSTGESSALRSSTSTTSQSYGATALISEAISSQLGGRIERLFGITRFRVDPFLAGTATEQNPAARVTIEQQVAHDLTITYSTNAASSQQQVIQVEYHIRRDVTLIALRDLNGTYSLSIEFKKHFN